METVIEQGTVTVTRDQFGKSLHLNDELGYSFGSLKFVKLISITLTQYGDKQPNKKFVNDGYIVHYINKDRKCDMRFNISCALGSIKVLDPNVDRVVLDVEYERKI